MTNDKFQLHNKNKKGFTLIEILVSLTIVGFLFGVGFTNYRDFSRRQELASLAKQIQGDFRLAQQMALAGQKPTDGSCAVLDGIRIGIPDSTHYRIRAECDDGTAGYVFKEIALPTGYTLSTTGPNPLLFKVLGLGNNIPSGTTTTITVTQTVTGNTATIVIGAAGSIK